MIKPYKNKILIEDPGKEGLSAGGIILLADRPKGIQMKSRVVTVGNEIKDINPGDEVFYDNIAVRDIDGDQFGMTGKMKLSIEFMVIAVIEDFGRVIRPRHKWIYIENPVLRNKLAGGNIEVVDPLKINKTVKSRVIAVGPEVRDIKVGDIVLYKNLKQIVVEEKYSFLPADDALAIVEE